MKLSTISHEDPPLSRVLQHEVELSLDASMQPFLADRVMRRIGSLHQSEEQLLHSLWHAFKPIALAGALVILGFISYNTLISRSYEVAPTPTEFIFGLQPLTVTTAYFTDVDELSAMIP